MSEKLHSKLGASGAHRWMHCPGSIQMAHGLPDVTSPYAREGTAAHALAEVWLTTGSIQGIEEIEGFPVTDEMRDAVGVFVERVRSLHAEHGGTLLVEHRFDLGALHPPVEMFGTADAAIVAPKALHVIDLKYGQGVRVEVTDNEQLLYYLLGVLLSLPPERRAQVAGNMTITVIQPRASHPDGVVRTAFVSASELAEYQKRLLAAAYATQQPDAPLMPGDWCRFCKAQAHCPALKQHTQELAQIDFDAVPIDTPPSPDRLPIEMVTDLLNKVPVIEDWIRGLRARVQRELEAGNDVPGWKMVLKRPTRKWIRAENVIEWAEQHGYDHKIWTEPELKSPAQVEKAVGKKNVPADLYQLVSSGPTLAPANDPRPPLPVGPQDEFAALPPASDN